MPTDGALSSAAGTRTFVTPFAFESTRVRVPAAAAVESDRALIGDLQERMIIVFGDQTVARAFADAPPTAAASLEVNLNAKMLRPRHMEAMASLARGGRLRGVAELQLGSNQLGDEGAGHFAAALAGMPALATLNLSHCHIGDAGLCALAAALGRGACPRLALLTMPENGGVGDEGASALAGSLGALAALVELRLTKARLGDAAAAAIAAAIARGHCGAMRKLWLYDNRIGDAGAASLAAAVRGGGVPHLMLHLANNQIGDAGAEAFAAACSAANAPILHQLSLAGNQITDRGCAALVGSLGAPRIAKLLLTSNRIGDAGARSLAAAFDAGGLALSDLTMEGNPIGDEAKAELKRAAAARGLLLC